MPAYPNTEVADMFLDRMAQSYNIQKVEARFCSVAVTDAIAREENRGQKPELNLRTGTKQNRNHIQVPPSTFGSNGKSPYQASGILTRVGAATNGLVGAKAAPENS